jgi:hypothetical protein
MTRMVARLIEAGEVDYSGWPLRKRLELLAFEPELAAIPRPLTGAAGRGSDVSGAAQTAGPRVVLPTRPL